MVETSQRVGEIRDMKNLIRLEELGMFLLSIMLFSTTEFAWWWFPALLLLPDLSMAGYAFNSRAGAILYNLFHHKGVGVVVYSIGFFAKVSYLELAGIILFAHSSIDRILGYGLKYMDSFKRTHLGPLG